MQPAREPSCVFEPSKYRVQILLSTNIHPILLWIFLCTSMLQDSFSPTREQGKISNCVCGGMDEDSA